MPTITATIKLVHSVGGLMAEITDLPRFEGTAWARHARLTEAAAEVLHAAYPELVIVGASQVDETTMQLWCERV